MKFKRSAIAVIAATLAASSFNVYSTNGIFLIGNGPKSRSMGGVGIGYTQDAIGYHMNPAGISSIGLGAMRVDLAAMIFRPIRSSAVPDPRDPPNAGNLIRYKSGANLYAIPSMGAAYKFNRRMYIGFSFVGAGGGGTRFNDLSPIGFNFLNPAGRTDVGETLGMNYALAEMSVGAAYKVTKNHSIGASPVFAIGSFRTFGLGVFKPFSSDPDNLTNRGNDYHWGAGARFGWQGKFTDWLTVGVAYTSRIYMTDFDKYRGLFAERGSLDIPENIGAGFVIKPIKKLTIAFDWQRVMYSNVRAIGNPIQNLAETSGFLGETDGAGFGWEDQDIFKVGIKYELTPKWDVSVGFNYAEVPMPDDQLLFSTIAPAVTEEHMTVGAAYRPNDNMEWTLAYVHAFKNTEKGLAESGGQFDQFFPNEDLTGPGPVELEMYQDSIEIGFSYKL